ncbi:MAG: hypothetical protein ACO3A2_03455 [Bdellovibrionia bacterium]
MQSVLDLTDKILTLSVSHPKSCQVAARRMISQPESARKLLVFFNQIGVDYSKQLFDRIPAHQWKYLLEINKEVISESNHASDAKSMLEVYITFLSESLTHGDSTEPEDPFVFLKELTSEELNGILGKEDPAQIAFISLYWSTEEMSKLLSCFSADLRRQVILHISRLERIPEKALEQAAWRFAKKIKQRFHGLFDQESLELLEDQESFASDGGSEESIEKIIAGIDLETEARILNYIKNRSSSIKLEILTSSEDQKKALS